jgi:hypothetical protein
MRLDAINWYTAGHKIDRDVRAVRYAYVADHRLYERSDGLFDLHSKRANAAGIIDNWSMSTPIRLRMDRLVAQCVVHDLLDAQRKRLTTLTYEGNNAVQ